MAASVCRLPPSFFSNCISPANSFRPSLHFAKNIFTFPKLFLPMLSETKIRGHSYQIRQSDNLYRPTPRFVNREFLDRCFRCGERGHFAKYCKIPIRCYHCGGFGHKSTRCFKKWKPRSKLPIRSTLVNVDCWLLQSANDSISIDVLDKMLLDPDIVTCERGFLEPVSVKPTVLKEDQRTSSFPGDIRVDFDGFQVPCTLDARVDAPHGQIQLELSPVHFVDIADLEIIDDFKDEHSDEDIYSDEDEFIADHVSKRNVVNSHSTEKQDGFLRAARARARGSDKLSPFKPKAANGNLEASKQSQHSDVPGNIKKNSKSGKSGLGPIMLCCVRRSPRLNKGNSVLR